MRIWCFDCFTGLKHNDSWGREVSRAALLRGHEAPMFKTAKEVTGGGYIFARRRQFPPLFDQDDRMHWELWRRHNLQWIQDSMQWGLYEDKIAQFRHFGQFMPATFVKTNPVEAQSLLSSGVLKFPFVSKSAFGSASHNVRLIQSKNEALAEIDAVFSDGVEASRGPGDSVRQKGYVLWQDFVPHEETWRVTAVGSRRHVYKRFCYPDRPVAAPASVIATQPVEMSAEVESLLDFSNRFFAYAGTKWCAIDVLKDGPRWRILEMSLAWARGDDAAGNAKFYGTDFSLLTQHDLLIREVEDGVFE